MDALKPGCFLGVRWLGLCFSGVAPLPVMVRMSRVMLRDIYHVPKDQSVPQLLRTRRKEVTHSAASAVICSNASLCLLNSSSSGCTACASSALPYCAGCESSKRASVSSICGYNGQTGLGRGRWKKVRPNERRARDAGSGRDRTHRFPSRMFAQSPSLSLSLIQALVSRCCWCAWSLEERSSMLEGLLLAISSVFFRREMNAPAADDSVQVNGSTMRSNPLEAGWSSPA